MLLNEEMEKRILVIEDDEPTLDLLLHFLLQHKGVEVQGSGLLEEGKALLAKFKPHLIISDINLPDGLGIDILSAVNSMDHTIPIIFISGFLEEYRNVIPTSPHITMMKKPISLQTLWENIKGKLFKDDGSFPFMLSDFIQLATQGKYTVIIEWKDKGEIRIKDGVLWSVSDVLGTGEEALKRMVVRSEVYRDGGKITCRRVDKEELEERNIFGSSEHLLLDAVSTEEDLLQTLPGRKKAFSRNLRQEAEFELLLDDAINTLLKKEYPRAMVLLQKAQAIKSDNKIVNANLMRMKEMGIKPEEEL